MSIGRIEAALRALYDFVYPQYLTSRQLKVFESLLREVAREVYDEGLRNGRDDERADKV